MTTTIRRLRRDDAAALCSLRNANRDFLEPWQPVRPDRFFTRAGQRSWIAGLLAGARSGTTEPQVILSDGVPIGQLTLSNIVRANFYSCNVGYWVAQAHTGRGHATAAVAQACALAFDQLGMHRIEAGTLPHNTASQRVLEKNGFTRFGLAPGYLLIAGRWQDHVLFQRLRDAQAPGEAS